MADPGQREIGRRAGRIEGREETCPVRTCAVTRRELPVVQLLRFALAPGGEIVPDVAGRLPGRGVWVTATWEVVADAVKSKAFQRSLKREVRVPPDLAERTEALLERRALEALSIANKAGLVTTGFEKVDALLASGSVAALLHARDAAEGGRQKLDRKYRAVAEDLGREARIVALFTVEQMSLAIGRANVVHAALKQGGAAERFLAEAGRRLRYRLIGAENAGICDTTLGSGPERD